MMSNATKIQITRDWFVEEFFKNAEILANWKNGQIILKTNSKEFPYAEIRIRPMTEEVGNKLITEILEKTESYEEHKRNKFIAKLMRKREK